MVAKIYNAWLFVVNIARGVLMMNHNAPARSYLPASPEQYPSKALKRRIESAQEGSESTRVIIVSLGIAAIIASFTFILACQLAEPMLKSDMSDAYFGSDLPRSFRNMVARVPYARRVIHPLYSMALLPITLPLHHVVGLSRITASSAVLCINAFLWSLLIFAICWNLSRRLSDSVLLVLFAASSASAVFWLPVPETFAFGSTTILLPLALISFQDWRHRKHLHIVSQVLAASMTITNWMSGLAASIVALRAKSALAVTIRAFVVIVFLYIAQSLLLGERNPLAGTRGTVGEARFLNTKSSIDTLEDFFFTPLSPNEIQYRIIPEGKEWPTNDLPNVDVLPRRGTVIRTIRPPILAGRARILALWFPWCVALTLGLYAALRASRRTIIWRAILLCLAGQLMLHLIYGTETFIYSIHWFPLLVVIVGAGLNTQLRIPLSAFLLVVTAYNLVVNIAMYQAVMEVFHSL